MTLTHALKRAMKQFGRWLQQLSAVLLLTMAASGAMPADPTFRATKEGMDIYIGVLPAAMVVGHEKEHGGIPRAKDAWHLVVALFDSATGKRISEATVKARIAEPGLAGQEKELQPMKINDTVTFGNYFTVSGSGPHRITVSITRPGSGRAVEARFEHRMP